MCVAKVLFFCCLFSFGFSKHVQICKDSKIKCMSDSSYRACLVVNGRGWLAGGIIDCPFGSVCDDDSPKKCVFNLPSQTEREYTGKPVTSCEPNHKEKAEKCYEYVECTEVKNGNQNWYELRIKSCLIGEAFNEFNKQCVPWFYTRCDLKTGLLSSAGPMEMSTKRNPLASPEMNSEELFSTGMPNVRPKTNSNDKSLKTKQDYLEVKHDNVNFKENDSEQSKNVPPETSVEETTEEIQTLSSPTLRKFRKKNLSSVDETTLPYMSEEENTSTGFTEKETTNIPPEKKYPKCYSEKPIVAEKCNQYYSCRKRVGKRSKAKTCLPGEGFNGKKCVPDENCVD